MTRDRTPPWLPSGTSRRERPSTQSSTAKPGRQRDLIFWGQTTLKVWVNVWWVNIFVHLNIWGYQPPARRARPDELLDQGDQDENDHQCFQCYHYFETWVVISVMITVLSLQIIISWSYDYFAFNIIILIILIKRTATVNTTERTRRKTSSCIYAKVYLFFLWSGGKWYVDI